MTARDSSIEEAIRTIVRSGEDVRNGWSDRQVVEQARRRAGGDITDATVDRLTATVAAIRSEADNDGQTLARVRDTEV